MRGPNGEAHVFKCLTHRGERKGFESTDNYDIASRRLTDASAELKLELKRLADAAGLDAATLDKIYNDDGNKPLLSRKIVAKIVTAIGKANKGADVWDGVKGAGTVDDTSISLSFTDEIDLEKYDKKGFKAMEEEDLLPYDAIENATALDDVSQIRNDNYLDSEWVKPINIAASILERDLPDAGNGFEKLSFHNVIAKPADMPLSRYGFCKTALRDQGSLYATFFKRELISELRKRGDEPLTYELRKKIAKDALRAAITEAWALTQLMKLAEKKGNQTSGLLEVLFFTDDKRTDAAFEALQDALVSAKSPAGFNNSLGNAWKKLTPIMKNLCAELHKGWEGDFNMYEVPLEKKATLNPPRDGVYMEDFYMD